MSPQRLKRLIRPKRGITGYGHSIQPDSWSGHVKECNLTEFYTERELYPKHLDGCQSGQMEPPAKRLDASQRLFPKAASS